MQGRLQPPPRPAKAASAIRKKGPPAGLHIETPGIHGNGLLAPPTADSSASSAAVSPATSESGFSFPPPPKGRVRNMKSLSLMLPSAQSSTSSLAIPPAEEPPTSAVPPPSAGRRRTSVSSLPVPTAPALLRGEEDGSPSAPYVDGPIEILPRIYLGAAHNATDWAMLRQKGIRSILNVAREVASPLDSVNTQQHRGFASMSDLHVQQDDFYPAHKLSGRPALYYLKLQWSHGQSDLVKNGFATAMAFVDRAHERGDGVLIHCQLGISRSATLVIGLVMRAAATKSASVPPEIWALKGMQGAYTYVKEKSPWVGPNMSLIYQLLDYERNLTGGSSSPAGSNHSRTSSDAADEEWGRRRAMLDEASEPEDEDRENPEIAREARALDKAMEDRVVARKASSSSIGSGIGMGAAWKNRYGSSRKRAGSVASNGTSNSMLSEDLVEEDEEQELLGTGGGFDATSIDNTSPDVLEGAHSSDDDHYASQATPMASRLQRPQIVVLPSAPASKPSFTLPPVPSGIRKRAQGMIAPSAPATKSTFSLPPMPKTAAKSSFDLPPVPKTAAKSSFDLPPIPKTASKPSFDLPPVPKMASKSSFDLPPLNTSAVGAAAKRRRPPPLGILPPVPHSPIATVESTPSTSVSSARSILLAQPQHSQPQLPPRARTVSRRPIPPPLQIMSQSNSSQKSLLLSAASTSSSRSHGSSSRNSRSSNGSRSSHQHPLFTPSSQTLFVFPPSPTQPSASYISGSATPSAMTLTSNPMPIPFPTISTPRLSSLRGQQGSSGKSRGFFGITTAPVTPTTAHSRVDARGWFGMK
ncbi:uncharacterized protein STEHIDRAFT_83382 [Stereum hirsutum FP-91666 SS1]|uniref:uncharacterized protein n=1 Tax=Stereum hirsutum (strain FP-91666) TaxID=721885 RepID=UPI000444A479|nr:uncharacterized protein STEHIDRAFT_83382 [Stereum hirsutum FP-91666 SS1]EIM83344.1 hypothetical protein STEHIDRAFT_83382 [Stereum hirsutum FP-91666 SS1]